MAKTVIISKKKFPLNTEFKLISIEGIGRLFDFQSDYDSCKSIMNSENNFWLPLYLDDSEEVKTLTTKYNNSLKIGVAYISKNFSRAYLNVDELKIKDKVKIENLILEDVNILNSLLKQTQ